MADENKEVLPDNSQRLAAKKRLTLPWRIKALSWANIFLCCIGALSSLNILINPEAKKTVLQQVNKHLADTNLPAGKIVSALMWVNLVFFFLLFIISAGVLLKKEIFRKMGVYYALVLAVFTGFSIFNAPSLSDRISGLLFFSWLCFMFFSLTRQDLNRVFK